MVYGFERSFAHHMLVIVGPSLNNRIEFDYQVPSFSLFVGGDDFPHLIQERFNVLLGWLD